MDEIDYAVAETERLKDIHLQNLSAALRVMSDTDTCIDCDSPIPEARRRAIPSAKRCRDCQDLADRGGH